MDIKKIFELVDEKINMLSEQDLYSPSVSIAEIKGVMNLTWTNCTKTKCERMPTTFQKRECKLDCQRTAMQDAANKITAQRGNCNRTANPQACMNTLDSSVKSIRMKISNIIKQIDATRKQEAQSQTRAAGGAAVGGTAAPTGVAGGGLAPGAV